MRYYGIPEDNRIGQRPIIHLLSLESLLLTPRCDRKPLLWVPSAVEWADRAQDLGRGTLPANLLPWPPELLEPVPWLGRVRPEFPTSELDWTHSLPVRTRFPASPVSMVRGTIRRPPRSTTGSERARESGTQLTIRFFATVSAGYIITGHSLSHSLDQFFQTTDSFRKESFNHSNN